jgi:hypothetical protein
MLQIRHEIVMENGFVTVYLGICDENLSSLLIHALVTTKDFVTIIHHKW